jgi:hypothetical protein
MNADKILPTPSKGPQLLRVAPHIREHAMPLLLAPSFFFLRLILHQLGHFFRDARTSYLARAIF